MDCLMVVPRKMKSFGRSSTGVFGEVAKSIFSLRFAPFDGFSNASPSPLCRTLAWTLFWHIYLKTRSTHFCKVSKGNILSQSGWPYFSECKKMEQSSSHQIQQLRTELTNRIRRGQCCTYTERISDFVCISAMPVEHWLIGTPARPRDS